MQDFYRSYGCIALAVALVGFGMLLGGSEAALVLLLFTGGLLLLLVELFILPGFGVAGIAGVVLLIVVGVLIGLQGGIAFSQLGGLVLAGAGAVLLARHVPRLPVFQRLVPANPHRWDVALPERYTDVAKVGDIGVVLTPLRLGGTARFGDRIVDVQSECDLVNAGTRVQVVRREGQTIIVQPLSEDDTQSQTDVT